MNNNKNIQIHNDKMRQGHLKGNGSLNLPTVSSAYEYLG